MFSLQRVYLLNGLSRDWVNETKSEWPWPGSRICVLSSTGFMSFETRYFQEQRNNITRTMPSKQKTTTHRLALNGCLCTVLLETLTVETSHLSSWL